MGMCVPVLEHKTGRGIDELSLHISNGAGDLPSFLVFTLLRSSLLGRNVLEQRKVHLVMIGKFLLQENDTRTPTRMTGCFEQVFLV